MRSIHLAVLIHGLHGSPVNLAECEVELVKAYNARKQNSTDEATNMELEVFIPSTFPGSLTFDGIEILAARVEEELDAKVEKLWSQGGDVKAISIMGYSLGGLIARYLVGSLDARTPSFFDKHAPASFSTRATPHLGMPKYGTRFSTIKHFIGGHMFSRTGAELFCWDSYSNEDPRPLLEVMSDPVQPFMRGLQRFSQVQIIANGCYDLTVPYPSAAICEYDPYDNFEKTGIKVQADDNDIVESWSFPSLEPGGDGEHETDALVKDEDPAVDLGKTVRKRPGVPPFFNFRFPFNYIVVPILPVLISLFVLSAFVTLTIQRFKSNTRIKRHRSSKQGVPLMVSNSVNQGYEQAAEFLSDQSENGWIGESHVKGKVQELLLSDVQKRMIRNFNQYLPKMQRVATWYPYAYNSHATIVVRDPKRFPHLEDGRPALRVWADWLVNSGSLIEG